MPFYSVSKYVSRNLDLFLKLIINERSDDIQCLPPCSYTLFALIYPTPLLPNLNVLCRYKTDHIGFDARSDRYGLFVQFDAEIEVTKSHLTIDPMTLLTRVGGVIGVGKNLLWIIIVCCTYTITMLTKIVRE